MEAQYSPSLRQRRCDCVSPTGNIRWHNFMSLRALALRHAFSASLRLLCPRIINTHTDEVWIF